MTPLADSGEATQPSPTDMPWPTISSEQTLSNDRPNGRGDRLFTLPPSVINVDDFQRFTPNKRHLKPKKLLKRLGKDFDSFWMSRNLPDDLLEIYVKQKLDTSLQGNLNAINLTALEHTLQAKFSSENGSGDGGEDVGGGGGIGGSNDMTSGVLDLIKSWLVQKASCPIYYIWEDLGLLYWPRWVRRGMCSVKDAPLFKLTSQPESNIPTFSSCSWPPGMHCVPANAKRLKILRWQCRNNKALNNFNRFQLPGMITPRSMPIKSHQDMQTSQSTTDNNYLVKHLHMGVNITLHRFQQLKKRTNNKDRKEVRNRRDSSRTPLQVTTNKHTETSQADSGLKGGTETYASQKIESVFQEHRKDFSGIPQRTEQIDDSSKVREETKGNVPAEADGKKQGETDRKKHGGADRKKQGDTDGNDTENWNSMNWKQRRRILDLKCKWVKIPYPVTDDCFCSC